MKILTLVFWFVIGWMIGQLFLKLIFPIEPEKQPPALIRPHVKIVV